MAEKFKSIQKKKSKSKKLAPVEDHKFDNICFKAYANVLQDSPNIIGEDIKTHELSVQALVDKGMSEYLSNIKAEIIQTRVQYGFLGKRSTGKLKYFQ